MTNLAPCWFKALSILVLTLICLVESRGIAATAVERYTGLMTLPIDLFTREGTRVEKGKYEIEISSDGSHWTLSFLAQGKERLVVKGEMAPGDLLIQSRMIPLLGTHYMRSASEPLKTAQERQFSKTGLPQYAEQERDWKATIRVYENSGESGEILFIFQLRKGGSQPTRAYFKLRSEVVPTKR